MMNYHMHINYSNDAVATLVGYCKKASELNISEICITNHQEWFNVTDKTYDFALRDDDWKRLIREIEEARKNFPGLKIKLGVELDYIPEYRSELAHFTEKWPFDFILGAVHVLNGVMLPSPYNNQDTPDLVQWYRDYFTKIIEMIENMDLDCIAHLDIVKKRSPKLGIRHYEDLIERMIQAMKKKNVGFEMNTMGFSHRCAEQYPSLEILKKLFNAGIRKVTIGSDCHEVDKFDYKLVEGIALLRKIGFREICSFTRRTPKYHPI